jgi:Raf kinase inhibitor-like YbhB/YbcL family protein
MKKCFLLLFLIIGMINYQAFAKEFSLESPAFKLNTMIPKLYTCDGSNISPPLVWQGAPPNTQSFVLIVDDPDSATGSWIHWVLYNIPPDLTKLDARRPVPDGASTGKNSWGILSYQGPCPPIRLHRYVFKLYALDTRLSLENAPTKDAVFRAMTDHVIGSSELIGLYQR